MTTQIKEVSRCECGHAFFEGDSCARCFKSNKFYRGKIINHFRSGWGAVKCKNFSRCGNKVDRTMIMKTVFCVECNKNRKLAQ